MKGRDARIVFMGTPGFAVASLGELVDNGYKIAGVVTSPDKPSGRGQKIAESAVSEYAKVKGLKLFKPERLKDEGFLKELKNLEADLFVVVAFRMLPESVWRMPRLGTFNLHASLLPDYRGAAPVNWAIINGEKETGVTTFLIDNQIDTGKILFCEPVKIGENDTAGDLHDRLMVTGARLVLKTVDALAEGKVQPVDQSLSGITAGKMKHAPKIFREDCMINWEKSAESIRNLIRGLSPYPAAWTMVENESENAKMSVKIYFAGSENENHGFNPGRIYSDNKTFLKVACSDGWILVTDLQAEGKRRMKTEEFLRGFQKINEYTAT